MQEIQCNFVEKERYESVFGLRGEKKKLGTYHGSYFSGVEGFGVTKWIIAAQIEGDFSEHSDLEPDELVQGCVAYLNKPVGKRKKRPLYGNLEIYRYNMGEDGKITVLLSIDQKKNKYFRGKGSVFRSHKRRKK